MIIYDNGKRLQYTDSAGVEQTVVTQEDLTGDAFAFCNLTAPQTMAAAWATVPITLLASKNATVSANKLVLRQPGIWFVIGQINANGYASSGTLYCQLDGMNSGSAYSGYDYNGNRRYGAVTRGMAISTGTSAITLTAQVSRDTGTQYPLINSAMVQAWCVQATTAAAASELLDSLTASGLIAEDDLP
ncbi:hypothetical protein ACWD2L_00510 [Streptomyces sp. NPDC002754]